ncbi:hypothetical protein BK699_09265 [Bacillus thuringiensis serovar mexicanensis]|uniref:Uncharacterized protein n=1 Tax=Bacillus thuringiensis serovar mexicanensis TaxID=180868 RepID=A0A242WAA4_BACTU|nr:hypothetical protein BK699_09265 [Bacillus thuringiensis serovar mexicanensis]OTX09419.1 hypothetical protein BK705_04310 [Bacillus thuringiensis serovar monterrey]
MMMLLVVFTFGLTNVKNIPGIALYFVTDLPIVAFSISVIAIITPPFINTYWHYKCYMKL